MFESSTPPRGGSRLFILHLWSFRAQLAVLALTLALLGAATLSAQITTGSISGTVVDPSGQVIPGATLTLLNEINGETRSGSSNATGDFIFPGLVAGTYTVRVAAAGFQGFERSGNVLSTAARLSVGKLTMTLGSVTETIEVSAQGEAVRTTASNNESVIDEQQVSMITIKGRDPIQILRILPGVSQGEGTDTFGDSYGTRLPVVQGRRDFTVYVDGVNGGDGNGSGVFSGATNIDAIAEVNSQNTSYTAEYGRSGGAQLQLITKRGGSEYHGTGYIYKRHEMFNANSFFGNKNGLEKQQYRFRTLGGNIGGPVPIKGVKDKLFFFYSIDDTQVKEPQPIRRYTMPTIAEKNGDFSGSPRTIVDPLNNNQPFANNMIPIARRDPQGSAIMNILADPNVNGDGFNFIIQEQDFQHPRRQNLIRVDFRPTDKDTISWKGQTWWTKSVGFEVAGGPSEWGLFRQRYDFTAPQSTVHYTRIVNPNIVNEFMVGIFYSTELAPFPDFDETANHGSRPPGDAGGEELALAQKNTYGLQGLQQFAPINNPLNLIPRADWTGLPQSGFISPDIKFDGRTPLTGADMALTGSNNLTYNHGAHTLKTGVWWEKAAARQARAGTFSGRFYFNHDGNDPASTGYAFSNSYTGHFAKYEEDLGRPPSPDRVQYNTAWFVQDTWKVHSRVTLDYGLRMYRWSELYQQGGESSIFSLERFDPSWGGNPPVLYNPVATGAGRRAQNPLTGAILPVSYVGSIVPGTGYSCSGAITPTTPCLYNGIVPQENNGNYVEGGRGFIDPIGIQYDPRFGLAWDVFGDGKTALRTAIGSYHEATGNVGGTYTGGPAFRYTQTILFSDIASMFNATPFTNPTNVSGPIRENQRRPNTYQYLLGIQRDVGYNLVLDVAYVGHTTHFVEQSYNFNLLPSGIRFRPENEDPSRPGVPLPDNFLRPYVGFGDMNQTRGSTTNRYDSLQVQFNRRYSAGLLISGSYTYANGMQNGWFQQLDSSNARRRNDLVQTHVFNISYVYDIPGGSKLIPGKVAKVILDNWQLSGITTFASGFPQDVNLQTSDGFDFSGGGESCGVVQTGPAQLPRSERTIDRWFDTSVFQRPSGRGDLGNNCHNYKFRGPGFNNWDITLFKNFPLGEGKRLQYRLEMYNAFNHTQFGQTGASYADRSVNADARFNAQGEQVNSQFGRVLDTRPERRMQMSLRFEF